MCGKPTNHQKMFPEHVASGNVQDLLLLSSKVRDRRKSYNLNGTGGLEFMGFSA
jgi:hypothetical protein